MTDYNTANFVIWDMPQGQGGDCVSLLYVYTKQTHAKYLKKSPLFYQKQAFVVFPLSIKHKPKYEETSKQICCRPAWVLKSVV